MEYKITIDELYHNAIRAFASEWEKTAEEVVEVAFERGIVLLAREYLAELGGDANL